MLNNFKINLVFVLLFFSFNGIGQECDNIVFSDGTEIDCIIKEFNTTEVAYKKCDFIEGPLYIVERNSIFLIKYKTGERVLMQQEPADSLTIYEQIDLIPIDNRCLLFYRKKDLFYGTIAEVNENVVFFRKCNASDGSKDYILKSTIVKIEDGHGNVIYTKDYQ